MSITFKLSTSVPTDAAASDSYQVVRRNGCILIYGHVPLGDVEVLAQLAPKDSLIDANLSHKLGATFVFGTRADLASLGKTVSVDLESYAHPDLSKQAVLWLAHGERGLSSETIFTLVTGVRCLEDDDMSVPHDTGDFRRCQRLLEQCPEIASNFTQVMSKQEGWGKIVQYWTEILTRLDKEAPNWRNPESRESTRETGQYMKSIMS